MSKRLVIGNWKMNPKSLKEAEALFKGIVTASKDSKNVDIVVCPPYPFLTTAKKVPNKKIKLGAQDTSEMLEGSYTSQVSSSMISSLGATYVIIGHSERRSIGDTDEIVNKKILQALKSKLIPVVCIGENVRDTHGDYLALVKYQLIDCLKNVSKLQMKNIVIAYEPVWAIGSHATRVATPEEFTEMKIFIRKVLSDIFDSKVAHATRVLYGGSVNPQNAQAFVDATADGFLVGRDSLNPKKFGAIIAVCK
ncbi:triose-phosphate isomerase [Candidatus Nomurabacteria bacterium]|nr:triose-phosphate isomerase [Candidatus Nomurabacteria bacterium]